MSVFRRASLAAAAAAVLVIASGLYVGTGLADPPTGGPPAAAPVRVELESVMVQRFKLYTTGDASAAPGESHMRIRLRARVAGPAEPIELGAVKLEQVTDEAGKSLVRGRQAGFFGAQRTKLGSSDRDGGAFSFDLPQTDAPSAGARRLKLIAGSVKVRLASQVRQVKYIGLVGKTGKQTTHPMLRELAVRVEAAEQPNAFAVRLTGAKAEAVVGAALSLPGGRELTPSQVQYAGNATDVTWTLLYDSPPPANAILTLDVAGRLSEVAAPFKFEDVELP